MNSRERHFTRFMDHDWGDGTFGRNDRVLYTCDEEGPDSPVYDEHFQPIGRVPIERQDADEQDEGIEEDNEPIAPPTGPVTLSYRRGEGLQSSWAIIKKGGVVFAEEPISHDLCDALLMNQRLLASCLHQCGNVMVELGWAFAPEFGLGLVYNNLLMILAGDPFQPRTWGKP